MSYMFTTKDIDCIMWEQWFVHSFAYLLSKLYYYAISFENIPHLQILHGSSHSTTLNQPSRPVSYITVTEQHYPCMAEHVWADLSDREFVYTGLNRCGSVLCVTPNTDVCFSPNKTCVSGWGGRGSGCHFINCGWANDISSLLLGIDWFGLYIYSLNIL